MLIITIILLSVALIIQTVYLLYYRKQIHDIGNQLSFISQHNSFKFIQTQMKPKEISRLIDLCNMLLQNQRELNQDFIKKSEEINSTIVSLSHDIRTPITSLGGYLHLAKRSEDCSEKTQYIMMAEARSKQINRLVDELFFYAKLQNPDYNLEIESLDIINLLKRHLFNFIESFTQSGNEPNVILPEKPIYLMANENALERVFENIIRNYFLHGKGALSIRIEEKKQETLFHFSNLLKDGRKVNIDKIFTRFYKEDLSRTKPSSGLGLSIVKSLMEKMNGHVYAALDEDQFSICIAFSKNQKEDENG